MNRKLSASLLAACFLLGITGCGQVTPEKEQVTIYLRNYAAHLGVFGEDEHGIKAVTGKAPLTIGV